MRCCPLQKLAALFLVTLTQTMPAQVAALPWPQADKLFHSDPRWLGGDAAFSIDLGHGKVLWMFNDSFVARSLGEGRAQADFVHNTVAIQQGYNPSQASIQFYWRTYHSRAKEIFRTEGATWMWPESGIRIRNKLLLFCTRVERNKSQTSLGFKLVGWNAYWVTNLDDSPLSWKLKLAARISDTVILASAVMQLDGFLYMFGESEPEHDLYVARLPVASVDKGEVRSLQWWSGNGWRTGLLHRRPVIVDVGTEASVQRAPDGNGFIEVNSQGFGDSEVVLRRSPTVQGPWASPKTIYRPPESDLPDMLVYAGKSHAELQGADLILTYATNSADQKLLKDMTLYFPRFIKVSVDERLEARPPS